MSKCHISCFFSSVNTNALKREERSVLLLIRLLLSFDANISPLLTDPLPPDPSLPPALLPHDSTEEEGAGPRRRLQQIGVSRAAFSEVGWREKKPRRTESRLLIETRSPTSFQTATTDLADDSIIKQRNFFFSGLCKTSRVMNELVLFSCCCFWFLIKRHFCLVGELAAVKRLYFGSGTVELPSEH